ncbi:hypothetical protein TorRG33x02_152200, partial [Trema orientale]
NSTEISSKFGEDGIGEGVFSSDIACFRRQARWRPKEVIFFVNGDDACQTNLIYIIERKSIQVGTGTYKYRKKPTRNVTPLNSPISIGVSSASLKELCSPI